MTAAAFWQAVAQRLAAGRRVLVAVVAAHTRGSPGTAGAHLLVDEAGETLGTIGGGAMESRLTAAARDVLTEADPRPRCQRLVHRAEAGAQASGLICAGEQINVSAVLEPGRDAATVARFVHALAEPGTAPISLRIDCRGVATVAARDTVAARIEYESGADWAYTEHSFNPRRLAIVGAGHCGHALARLAAEIGHEVTLFDTRPACLDSDWPGTVRAVTLARYDELSDRLAQPSVTRVRVMTHAVTEDIAALIALSPLRCRSLGVMGSSAKIRRIRDGLRDAGVRAEQIAAIAAPIGLPMKSDTPTEIAVSVMAEILADERTAARAATRVNQKE